MPRRPAQRRIAGGVGDLVEQVEQLPHRANEVTGGQIGLGENRLEPVSIGPTPSHVGKAQVGLAQEVQRVVFLQRVEIAP